MDTTLPEPQRLDSAAHQRAIEALAHEAQVPIEDVCQLYAREWAAIAAGARITQFLPLLTLRQVRAILRHRGTPS